MHRILAVPLAVVLAGLLSMAVACGGGEGAEKSPVASAEPQSFGELTEAVKVRDIAEVSRLLTEGADVNERPAKEGTLSDGWTPLHHAALYPYNGGGVDTSIALLLIEAGADLEARDASGGTPLLYAAGSTKNPDDCIEYARLLIEQGADVNAQTDAGLTPLYRAAHDGCTGTAELLIDAGADVNGSAEFHQTPLSAAIESEHYDTAELLRSRGAVE